ncbi:MAG: ABC transporter ATP-binding protein [Bacillota bacterium]|nr:ABC transporter ATP-binding protein [Bacillota bacterium]
MIKLKNVSKYYYSKGMISSGISKVNLEFNIGEFVVITGESGSGKTTLLNVISGLDSYEEGEMYINGVETSHYIESDFEEYRKKYIGNIFQDYNLINSYTVYQNIELVLMIKGCSREEISKRVPEIIEKVGLTSHAKSKVSKLSGGQKQRVAIARALAKDTDIIVADEPTGNLDSVSAAGIIALLSEIAKDKLVIVVTHNYEQFMMHATRTIKMHDGKIAEDKTFKTPQPTAGTSAELEAVSSKDDISAGDKVRLGVRNTFNILPKFLLLLVVLLFVVFGVTSQYTTLQHQQAEESKLGYNDYFYNYSEDRIVLKKVDGSSFGEDDYVAMKNAANVKSVVLDDMMLDNNLYIEDGDFSYEAYPSVIGDFNGKLAAGRMPEKENEAILTSYKDEYYFNDETISKIINKTYYIWIGEEKQLAVTIVGCAYKQDTGDYDAMMYSGSLYVTDELMAIMREEIYNYNSVITVTMNGKEEEYIPGNVYYRVVPNSKVKEGEVLGFEEIDNFYGESGAKGKSLTIAAENIFFKESVKLKVTDTYTERNFKAKTGVSDFEEHGGTLYVNQKDYDTLFKKNNYQATVYVEDVKMIDDTMSALEKMGYTTLPLKDTLISYSDGLGSIIRVPMAVILTFAIFFIAYFVIRLILRSRSAYFSILRMLGMAKKNIRRVLDIEMLVIVNLAYAIFLAFILFVKNGWIRVDYIINLIQYMGVTDYIVLYVVILIMAYLISGKFARHLFKKTAMNTFREGDR